MKRKILIMFILLLFPCAVFAREEKIYGEEIVSNNLLNESRYELEYSKRFYNTYKLNKLTVGYGIEDCTNVNYDDYKETNVTFKYDKNATDNYYELIKTFYDDYFEFDFYEFPSDIKISEIDVTDADGNKIDFDLYNQNDLERDISSLTDDDLDNYIYFEKSPRFILNFKENIKPIIYIKFYSDKNINKGLFYLKNGSFYSKFNSTKYDLLSSNIVIMDSDTFSKYSSQSREQDKFIRYADKVYACVKEEKEILNEYKEDGDNLIYDDYYDEYYYREYFINNIEDEVIDNNVIDEIKPVELLSPKASNKVIKNNVSNVTKDIVKSITTNKIDEVAEVEPVINRDVVKISDANDPLKLLLKIILGITLFLIFSMICTYIYVKKN